MQTFSIWVIVWNLFSGILKPKSIINDAMFSVSRVACNLFIYFRNKLSFPKVFSLIFGSLRVNEIVPLAECRGLWFEILRWAVLFIYLLPPNVIHSLLCFPWHLSKLYQVSVANFNRASSGGRGLLSRIYRSFLWLLRYFICLLEQELIYFFTLKQCVQIKENH